LLAANGDGFEAHGLIKEASERQPVINHHHTFQPCLVWQFLQACAFRCSRGTVYDTMWFLLFWLSSFDQARRWCVVLGHCRRVWFVMFCCCVTIL
jgi:hypothetical protein